MCFPVRKKSGRSSLALAVWNSSLSLNLHSSSSSSLPTVCRKELRSALMTHRVAPIGRQTGGRGLKMLHVAHLGTQHEIWDVTYGLICTVLLLNKKHHFISFHYLYLVCLCTFEERELLEKPRSDKGVGETEEKATEQQPSGADVDRVRSGTHKTHRHLQEARRVWV